ncbi:hypothetical protein FSZ31_04740 [Sphingorhabdus soli]|uniref:Uncharacterized protein n=1 Tax=Flavisphingopyxis soli TaxID=2601267 RepID=A0A5C6UPF1_9SPHN|nr:hypothetical protein [Sphingorhabdus soli]TXC74031.1 hypothetical protein FSZ31_04740 [Sphingorhabdus soli]
MNDTTTKEIMMDGQVDTSGEDLSDYDEDQRAEILEVEGHHPVKDGIETDLNPDRGEPIDDEEANDETLTESDKP